MPLYISFKHDEVVAVRKEKHLTPLAVILLMVVKGEHSHRSYIRYVLWILLVLIAAVAFIAVIFWITDRTAHVEMISIIATLIMASIGITAAVLSLDLNAKTLDQNERMIRLTEFANRPFFDKDTFVCSGSHDQIVFSVTNIGGKAAYISKVTIRLRGTRSLDWEAVPPEDHRTIESGGVFFQTINIGGTEEQTKGTVKKGNAEIIVIRVDYKNFEHRDIEMKDLTVSHAFKRDHNHFISSNEKK
jgi:F0F1-type ATP synthase assembly protein I